MCDKQEEIGGYWTRQRCQECGNIFGTANVEWPITGSDSDIVWDFICDDCAERLEAEWDELDEYDAQFDERYQRDDDPA